ncbi:uncharacterized protein V1518DRAFT_389704 [Limtongia smithiae]|uniref:uncharacterized protein n=1 Tax=Limtongia smithiae TaxID=1125753 RepID=UPI0034CD457B
MAEDVIPHAEIQVGTVTSLPPCALAYYPNDRRFLLVGTYNLVKETGVRNGSLDVYYTDEHTLNLVQSIESPESSILDVKFSPHDHSLLVSAHSTGHINLWTVSLLSSSTINVLLKRKVQITEPEILVLSFCFSPTEHGIVAATLSSGSCLLADISDHSVQELDSPRLRNFATKHSLEAWIAAFHASGGTLFTGGDDCAFISHAITFSNSTFATYDEEDDEQMLWVDRHSHGAGVTAVLPFPTNSNILWTGSYDDKLRIWDLHSQSGRKRPALKQEIYLGGGVWRLEPELKPSTDGKTLVLACCMYGGARVLETTDGQEAVVVKTITESHDSMVYGCAWGVGRTFATCSFYDKRLNIWRI